MVILTSVIAGLIILIPVPKLVAFHPRHYSMSIIIYWFLDLAKGIVITFLAYLIGGWFEAYLASILAVVMTLFLLKCNTFAVAAGSTFVLSPILIFIGIGVFLVSLLITRYYFLSTFFTVVSVIIFGLILASHLAIWATIFTLGIIVCWGHRHHFRRYRRGIEKQMQW
jgi:glycerol-3-phosphate acyltransferase PlsY